MLYERLIKKYGEIVNVWSFNTNTRIGLFINRKINKKVSIIYTFGFLLKKHNIYTINENKAKQFSLEYFEKVNEIYLNEGSINSGAKLEYNNGDIVLYKRLNPIAIIK